MNPVPRKTVAQQTNSYSFRVEVGGWGIYLVVNEPDLVQPSPKGSKTFIQRDFQPGSEGHVQKSLVLDLVCLVYHQQLDL